MIRLERSTHGIRSIDDKIIPMINVIFLLLMFFLIVGNLQRSGRSWQVGASHPQ